MDRDIITHFLVGSFSSNFLEIHNLQFNEMVNLLLKYKLIILLKKKIKIGSFLSLLSKLDIFCSLII